MFFSCWSDMERVRMKSCSIVGERLPPASSLPLLFPDVLRDWFVMMSKGSMRTMVNAPFLFITSTVSAAWVSYSSHFHPKKKNVKSSSNLSDIYSLTSQIAKTPPFSSGFVRKSVQPSIDFGSFFYCFGTTLKAFTLRSPHITVD